MNDQTVTIVGAGRLGGAVVRGYLRAGFERERIHIVQRPGATFERWRAQGMSVSPGFEATTSAVLVAVKPKALAEVIAGLRASPWPSTPVISLASGMSLATWRTELGPRFPVLRARANVLVASGRGNVLLATGADPTVEATVLRLLEPLGTVHRVPEPDMVAQTWFSSSLPIVGVSRVLLAGLASEREPSRLETADQLVLQALRGLTEQLAEAAQAAESRGERFSLSTALEQLVDQVATPGGMNATAFELLERGGLSDLLESVHQAYLSKEGLEPPSDDPEEQR